MEFIISDQNGMEVDILKERQYIDMDCGGDNDFEIQISRKLYKSLGINEGWRIGVPGTEYGGIIHKIKNSSSTNKVTLSGPTWRGLLTKKIIEPDPGEDYKIVSGEANTIINNLSCVAFDGIFSCTGASGIMINNYHFERYVDHLAGLEKMLLTKNARLNIAYDSGEPNKASYVKLSAVPIEDYSDEIEYSRDGTLSYLTFEFERYTGGINHLICLGKGDLKDRLVIHLYVQKDGSIGSEKYYTGKDERVDVYDYPNAESAADLQEKGIERLKKLMSYTNMDMDLVNQSLSGIRGVTDSIDIGDIVGGRDFDTGIYLSKQITRKIIRVKNGKESIEYSVGKNTLNRSTATAPVEPEDAYQKQIDGLKGDMSGKLDIAGIDLTDKTLSQVVEFIASKPQRMVFGHLKLPAEAAPDGIGWYKALCALLNAPYGSSDIAGHMLLLKGDREWVGYITGKSDFAVSWMEINHDDASDFVVAQGTSGIWAYRKWNSGYAECWGAHSFTPSWTVAGNLYYCYTSAISLPFTFVNLQSFTATCMNSPLLRWASGNRKDGKQSTVNALVMQCNDSSTSSVLLALHCHGTWK